MLVPGFTVRELPVRLSNVNNLRFAPDGRLTALGYDGRVWLLRDADGDGLEDTAEPFWDQTTLRVPVGMAWSTAGLYVSSQGKVSLLRDTDGDGKADTEDVIASGWPKTDVGSGGVDATAVTLDAEGNVYFGLLTADYSNAYRLRKRKDLKPEEIAWLQARGDKGGPPDEEVSLYDTNSMRGTIQKWNSRTRRLETLATGIRVPYTLAFNTAGALFVTDQEGETWCPNGNPLDELNHIIPGRNYGFPPRHEKWLPDLVSEPPVAAFGPQHQSACGFVFNEPRGLSERGSVGASERESVGAGRSLRSDARTLGRSDAPRPSSPAQGLFGPKWWEGDAIVAGESRGKLWRVRLTDTPRGYTGKEHLIARLDMLTTDVAISPKGDLYVSCHSGPPDWGTGPKGEGKLFKISYTDSQAPQPVEAAALGPQRLRLRFDTEIDPEVTNHVAAMRLLAGAHVTAGHRDEVLKPPYKVVKEQDAAPTWHVELRAAGLQEAGRALALETAEPFFAGVRYALTVAGVRAKGATSLPSTVDVDIDTRGAGPLPTAPVAKRERAPEAKLSGDFARGRALFFSQRLQCGQCHRVRGEGGVVGPDLSNLVHRDAASVLRDIKDPDASINPDYVAHHVTLRNGDQLTGSVRADSDGGLRVLTADARETAVPREEVSELRASAVSLMPTGLLEGLSEREVQDLVVFLVAGPPPEQAKTPTSSSSSSNAKPKENAPKPGGKTPPPPRTRAEVQAALASPGNHQSSIVNDKSPRPVHLALVASKQDHGPGEHDYPTWQTNWTKLLGQAERVAVSTAWKWPSPDQFQKADVLVFYFWNHEWTPERYAALDAFLARGGGLVILHSACIADTEPEPLAERIGLSAQPSRTKYRHGPLDLRIAAPPGHALTRGLPAQMHLVDETYWPMIGDTNKVEVLATAEEEGKSWPMLWTFRKGQGRVFGSILGHYSWTYDDPLFRLLVLRGLAWAAGETPERFEPLSTVGVTLQE
jgi:putative heme-binding domain-containing protein